MHWLTIWIKHPQQSLHSQGSPTSLSEFCSTSSPSWRNKVQKSHNLRTQAEKHKNWQEQKLREYQSMTPAAAEFDKFPKPRESFNWKTSPSVRAPTQNVVPKTPQRENPPREVNGCSSTNNTELKLEHEQPAQKHMHQECHQRLPRNRRSLHRVEFESHVRIWRIALLESFGTSLWLILIVAIFPSKVAFSFFKVYYTG